LITFSWCINDMSNGNKKRQCQKSKSKENVFLTYNLDNLHLVPMDWEKLVRVVIIDHYTLEFHMDYKDEKCSIEFFTQWSQLTYLYLMNLNEVENLLLLSQNHW
jgi:hypothetical protein